MSDLTIPIYGRRPHDPVWRGRLFGLSLTFWVVVGVFIVGICGCLFTHSKVYLAVFVLSGWLISLTLHEWAHAYMAYKGGDHRIYDGGYLSLDLTLYSDFLSTILVPMLSVMLGGVPLPGASISVEPHYVQSQLWESTTALAGMVMNLVFAGILVVLLHLIHGFVNSLNLLLPALSLLIYFQVLGALLHLLPLPPLDGWMAIAPWIEDSCWLKSTLYNPTHKKLSMLVSLICVLLLFAFTPVSSWCMDYSKLVFGVEPRDIQKGLQIMASFFKFY